MALFVSKCLEMSRNVSKFHYFHAGAGPSGHCEVGSGKAKPFNRKYITERQTDVYFLCVRRWAFWEGIGVWCLVFTGRVGRLGLGVGEFFCVVRHALCVPGCPANRLFHRLHNRSVTNCLIKMQLPSCLRSLLWQAKIGRKHRDSPNFQSKPPWASVFEGLHHRISVILQCGRAGVWN
jgi:hypothetical protein